MSGLDVFSWIVLLVIIVSVVAVALALAALPGRIARSRGHKYADAVNVAGWLGLLLTVGIVWIVAMIWAHMTDGAPDAVTDGEQSA